MKRFLFSFTICALVLFSSCGSKNTTRDIDKNDPMGEEDMPKKLDDSKKGPNSDLESKLDTTSNGGKQSSDPAKPLN